MYCYTSMMYLLNLLFLDALYKLMLAYVLFQMNLNLFPINPPLQSEILMDY